jgi:hypothetical protein
MAYAHFEDMDEVVISNSVGSQPEELADFVLGSVVQSHLQEMRHRKSHRHSAGHRHSSSTSDELTALTQRQGQGPGRHEERSDVEEQHATEELSPVEVHRRALEILRSTVALLERNQIALQNGVEMTHLATPEIMKRYGATATQQREQQKRGMR